MSHWMKRILSLTAALLLLCTAAVAQTASLNVSTLSDDEVLQLYKQLNQELVSRGLEKTAVMPKGTYLVGEALPAGQYIYTCMAQGSDWGNMTVYADGGKGDQLVWEVLLAPEEGEQPETVFLKLKEGDELSSQVPFSLTISPGIHFQ